MSRIKLFLAMVVLLAIQALPAIAVTDADLDEATRREVWRTEQTYGLDPDPALNARVQTVFARVVSASAPCRWPLHVRVINHPYPNAFSLPSGMVYVHSGLFALQPDDDELAFVLAHEIAHVCREHVKLLAERSGAFADPAYITGYSRYNETQADLDGVAAAYHAGYHPMGAVRILQKMGTLEPPNAALISPDHPITAERIHNVFALFTQHPEWAQPPAR